MLVEEAGQLLDHLHVVDDLLAHARALDLHRHPPAVAQDRPVHLAQGCAGHRFGLEGLEGVRDPGPDLGRDPLLDLGEGDGLDVVLQPAEGVEVDGWEEVGPGGEQLAQLDEGGPHRLEVVDELLGVLGGGDLGRRRVLGVVVTDAAGSPVLHQQGGHVLVAGQVVNVERDGHPGAGTHPRSAQTPAGRPPAAEDNRR